jgi:glycosyltransferase involved in cell wall biosynthesis
MALGGTPLVSIVTPSYNMARYLTETIESVLGQDYPRIEYIVMDGGSTDGTVAILEQYKDRLTFTSGRDGGTSDAIFQGFRRAKGEIFAWLNADDAFLPGAVRTAVEYLQSHPDVDVVYGECWWIDDQGGRIGRYPSLAFDPRTLERDCFLCQPAVFLRASSYRRCELDPGVRWSFDYDLWIRMAKANFRFAFIPQYLANSRMHEGAMTLKERDTVFHFSMNLLLRHYGYVPLPWIIGYTAFRIDRRDQFFEPLQLSVWKYLVSLPVGLWWNRQAPFRFFGEWAVKPFQTLFRQGKERRGRLV